MVNDPGKPKSLTVAPGNHSDECPLCGIHRQNAGYHKVTCGDTYLQPGCFITPATERKPMTAKEMIEERCAKEGMTIRDWSITDEGDTATLGSFTVITPDYEDDGLYEGDTGELTACVVGAEKYHNQRVSFTFITEGCDGGNEVRDLLALDPADD